MTHLGIFAIVTILAAAMIVARSPWVRWLCSLPFIFTTYIALAMLLGEPKPARVEMFASLDRAEVLWFAGSEATGIHVVLAGPRLYSLPWSERTMRSLHEAGQQAEANGGTVEMRRGETEGGEWVAGHRAPPEPAPKG